MCPGFDSASKNVYQVNPGGKGGRCVRLTTYHLHVPIVKKSGGLNLLEPCGPVQACNRTDLPLPNSKVYPLSQLHRSSCSFHWMPDISDKMSYTGCSRRNVQYFGRVFLMLNYTDITQNTYIQSWTVTEIKAREVWNFDSCYTLIDYQIYIETGRNMWFRYC